MVTLFSDSRPLFRVHSNVLGAASQCDGGGEQGSECLKGREENVRPILISGRVGVQSLHTKYIWLGFYKKEVPRVTDSLAVSQNFGFSSTDSSRWVLCWHLVGFRSTFKVIP